jgi:hypothetical protein
MTIPSLSAVGFCAHYSPAGDVAFATALRLAREHGLQLNVFHFLVDPYDPQPPGERLYSRADLAQIVMERERELRLYYDERAGDYLDVGFRLCYDESWRELHRCLANREFQLLVLAKPAPDAWFCRHPIETFADRFVCPVMLVEPGEPPRFRLNSSAALLADRFGLPADRYERIEAADVAGR